MNNGNVTTAKNTVTSPNSWCVNFVERHSFRIISGKFHFFYLVFKVKPFAKDYKALVAKLYRCENY